MSRVDENINPSWYKRSNIECIDAIEEMAEGWPPQTAYRLGCLLKYIWRHRDKGNPVEDLKKAMWYLEEEIKALSETDDGWKPVEKKSILYVRIV
jgi:hypothetical protein